MEQYEAWKALLRAGEATGWQEFYVKFYQAFIDGSRWKQYFNGVGTTLMETLLDLADHWLMLVRVELEVFADNEQAIRLYEKLGFEKDYVAGVLEGIKTVKKTRKVPYRKEDFHNYLAIEWELIYGAALYIYEFSRRQIRKKMAGPAKS